VKIPRGIVTQILCLKKNLMMIKITFNIDFYHTAFRR
jgi:hypothetical protein